MNAFFVVNTAEIEMKFGFDINTFIRTMGLPILIFMIIKKVHMIIMNVCVNNSRFFMDMKNVIIFIWFYLK